MMHLPLEKDFNKKQQRAMAVIREVALGKDHNHTVYGEAQVALKKKRLGKVFNLEELYWICTEEWVDQTCGGISDEKK